MNQQTMRRVDGDLQAVVNCSEEGDIIELDFNGQLQFTTRVTLPWNLTVTGRVRNTALQEGIFPEARRKQRITCPGDDEGIFLVQLDPSACLHASIDDGFQILGHEMCC